MNSAKEMYAYGLSVFTIAAKLGLSVADAYRAMGETPIKLVSVDVSEKAHTKMTAADTEQVRGLYSAGKSVRQIAEATGWSRHRVRSTVGDIYRDDRVKLTQAQLSDLYDFFDKGADVAALSEQFKVTKKTISRALKVYHDALACRDKREAANALVKAGWSQRKIDEFFSKRA